MAEILHFPDRSLLKLIDAVNGVLNGTTEPTAEMRDLTRDILEHFGEDTHET